LDDGTGSSRCKYKGQLEVFGVAHEYAQQPAARILFLSCFEHESVKSCQRGDQSHLSMSLETPFIIPINRKQQPMSSNDAEMIRIHGVLVQAVAHVDLNRPVHFDAF